MAGSRVRLAVLALLGAAASAGAAPETLRIAWIGPLTGPLAKAGEESLLGVQIAAEQWTGRRPVEVVSFDDGEDPKKSAELLADAQEKKFTAVIAMETSRTVGPLSAKGRESRMPVIFAGPVGPKPTVDPATPLLSMAPWPVDQALNITSMLHLHSDNGGIGLYRDCSKPAIIAEDSDRGHEMADALARNIGPRQALAGTVFVLPHMAPTKEDVKRLRDARCDRILLAGEPDLIDRTFDAMKPLGWQVPFFCADGMLSRASVSIHDGTVKKANFLCGVSAKAQLKTEVPTDGPKRETPAEDLRAALEKRLGAGTPVYSRTRNGWFAAWLVLHASETCKHAAGAELLASLRALTYSMQEERARPLLDDIGHAALTQWFLWNMGEKGPQPITANYLPTRDLGPMLRMKKAEDWDKVAINDETTVIWLTFGEKEPKVKSDPARTIEEDMGALGLGTRGYEAELDPWLLDELMNRALGKINRLFFKNYDGTFIPGVSFNIHFTATKPEHLKPSQYHTAIIAGEESWDPKIDKPTEGAPGGKTAGGRVWIYSRWMRYWTDIKNHALKPKMSRDDKKYLDGTYSWGTTWEENVRGDALRALVDGYSSFFSMTGAHELGHVFGCGHDTESQRSIMNVVEAVGLRDTQACWIPDDIKLIETVVGRYPGKKH